MKAAGYGPQVVFAGVGFVIALGLLWAVYALIRANSGDSFDDRLAMHILVPVVAIGGVVTGWKLGRRRAMRRLSLWLDEETKGASKGEE